MERLRRVSITGGSDKPVAAVQHRLSTATGRGKSVPGALCGCGFRETQGSGWGNSLYLLLRKLESEGPKKFYRVKPDSAQREGVRGSGVNSQTFREHQAWRWQGF